MLGLEPVTVREYVTEDGRNAFGEWFLSLDSQAAARVLQVLVRMELGNFGDTKSVGGGVSERRINFGPGYRVYFAKDGDVLVILLGGGTKRRQSRDIDEAKQLWTDYKSRKRKGH